MSRLFCSQSAASHRAQAQFISQPDSEDQMSFTPEQVGHLKAKLSRSRVQQRSQAGRQFSYVEGWHAIAEANRIFGFDAWSRETVELRLLGERQVGDKSRVAYMARVRITVQAGDATIIRDGCGYGSGIDKDIGQAHESALKEAETDAMKRGLMTFGNPFGLALYDKNQANVGDDAPPDNDSVDPDAAARQFIAECEHKIGTAADRASLLTWWNSEERKQAFRDFELNDDEMRDLQRRVTAQAEALKPRAVS